MNRFWTGQGPCRANLHKCGLAQSPSCDCGKRQTTNHIVDTCPLTKSEGGLNLLHEADDDAFSFVFLILFLKLQFMHIYTCTIYFWKFQPMYKPVVYDDFLTSQNFDAVT